jgi:hypothetical protein
MLLCLTATVQELKKKELDELDAIFSELGISVEEQAKRDAEAEKKRKKKEKKKAAANGDEAAAANGSSAEQQQQQPAAAAAPAEDVAAEQEEEPSGEALDPAAVSSPVIKLGTRGSKVMSMQIAGERGSASGWWWWWWGGYRPGCSEKWCCRGQLMEAATCCLCKLQGSVKCCRLEWLCQ